MSENDERLWKRICKLEAALEKTDRIEEEIKIVRRVAYRMPETVEAWALINVAKKLEDLIALNVKDQNHT